MKRALFFGVLALTLVPQSAAACGEEDDCDISNRWQKFELTSTVVPTDGVLVFNGERGPNAGGMTDAEALAFVSAEVTADGQTIAGTLESDEGWRGVVWRPDAPLPAGASVSVILSVDNEALDPFDDCEVQGLELGPFIAEVSAGLMPELVLDDVITTTVSEVDVRGVSELDELVCCRGAYPRATHEACDAQGYAWEDGYCTHTRGFGWLYTTASLNLDALAPELSGSLAWRVETEVKEHPAKQGTAEVQVVRDEPFCAHIEVLERASGEVFELEERCFGDDVADMLGLIDIDPIDMLDAKCAGSEPYTCELLDSDDAWDPNACEAYPSDGEPGDGETGDGNVSADDGAEGAGCACTASDRPAAPLALGGLLLLLGLVRRRR